MKVILIKIWSSWIWITHKFNQIFIYVLLSLMFIVIIIPQSFLKNLIHSKKYSKGGWIVRKHIFTFEDLRKLW